MKIAIDISPLTSGHFLQHRVRGTGFYLQNLRENLLKYYSNDSYLFFKRGDKISKEINVIHFPYFEPFFLTLPFNISSNSIVTVHDLTPFVFKDQFPSGTRGKIKWQIQKRSLKKAGAIITDSKSSKRDIERFTNIDPSKIYVVYLAAGESFKPQKDQEIERVKNKFNLPEKYFLYVGDVTWNKNLPNLLKAVREANVPLVIAGQAFVKTNYDKNNPWNKSLSKAQKLASDNKKVMALGFVSDEDLACLYSGAQGFVMPSFYEGFGLPVLEAMQSGCPVICSDAGSLAEVAGDAAYFVDPKSVDSIRQGIERIFSDQDLRSRLAKAGLVQSKKFSWEKTAKETHKVYEKIFEQTHR